MDRRADNPEDSAITGGAPPAAEPPPQTRDRLSAFVAYPWLMLIVGLVLALIALIGDQGTDAALGTAVAGVALIALAVLSMAGVLGTVLAAILGFGAAALLTVVAISGSRFGLTDAVLLGSGAAAFLGSFASLASSRRFAAGEGDEERSPGVENV